MATEQPNLTQFFGSTPSIPKDPADADPKADFSIPSPYEEPDLWDSVKFKSLDDKDEWLLPPPGMGHVEVEAGPEANIDTKGGAGKPAPRQTKVGGKAVEGKITIHWIDEAWPYILAACRALSPGSGPWSVWHPKLDIAGVSEIEIAKWEDAPSETAEEGFAGTWTLNYKQIVPSAQSGKGGGSAADTPEDGTVDLNGVPVNTRTGIPQDVQDILDASKAKKP